MEKVPVALGVNVGGAGVGVTLDDKDTCPVRVETVVGEKV